MYKNELERVGGEGIRLESFQQELEGKVLVNSLTFEECETAFMLSEDTR